jgi:hypothetical protein
VTSRTGRAVATVLAVLFVAVGAGIVALWPGDDRAAVGPIAAGEIVAATVDGVTGQGCERFAGEGCQLARVTLTGGREAGRQSYLALPSTQFAPALERGDRIRVARNTTPGGSQAPLDDRDIQPLSFVDFERGRALAVLVFAFAVLVVALAGWQGVRSLIGLGVGLAIVVGWMVPSLLAGNPPLAVALIGGLAVMLVTTVLTHGFGLKSAAAMLGAAATLLLIVGAGAAAVDLAWLAAGRVDAFFERGLHHWDWAAGRLLVEEAGGSCVWLDDGWPGLLAASHDELLAELQPFVAS